MYRNLTYKIDFEKNIGVITLFTWDEKGKPVTQQHEHTSWLYKEDINGTDNTMYGTKCTRLEFPHSYARKQWLTENGTLYRTFECLKPESEFLINKFEGQEESPDFRKNKLRTHYYDIEVAVEGEFPDPKDANYPINAIAIFDDVDQKFTSWVLTDKKYHEKDVQKKFPSTVNCPIKKKNKDGTFSDEEVDEYYPVTYHVFDNEKKMLQHYLDWHASGNWADVISGWYIAGFDNIYVVNRINKVIGGNAVSKLSPVGKVKKSVEKTKLGGETETYSFEGVTILDYKTLYKDKFGSGERRPNYKLETISNIELGIGKLKYDCTMSEFWKNDFPRWIEYNLIDTIRVYQIDRSKKYIDLARLICNVSLQPYPSILGSIPIIYGAATLISRKIGMKALSTTTEEKVSEAYEGAYVRDPEVGLYSEGVKSIDLASLYPNIMITCNISPEVKIGRIIDDKDPDSIVFKVANGEIKYFTRDQINKLKTKAIHCPNGAFFSKNKKGLMNHYCEIFYNKRVEYKARQKEALQNKDMEAYDLLESYQMAFKILLNSAYGAFASKYFPLFDVDCASAITLSGQEVIKNSCNFMDNLIKTKYADVYVSTRPAIIYGDTDSGYFDISPIVRKFNKDWQLICKECDDNTAELNIFLQTWAKEKFNTDKVTLRFEREAVGKSGIFLAKKKYAIMVLNSGAKDKATGEYIMKSKLKVVGIELKKSELSDSIKEYLTEVYVGLLEADHKWTNEHYLSLINKFWISFSNMNPNDIGLWKGYNTKKESTGLVDMEVGATGIAKACEYHNNIIKHMKVGDKYDPIKIGDRVRFIYISTNNPYKINSIAWQGDWYTEFSNIFKLDYELMFTKVIMQPLKRVEEVCGFNSGSLNIFNKVVTSIEDF